MAQWAKVFPSTADKIFVSQADSDSPTGFGLVEKSVSEMKTLLGLPVSIYVAKIQQSSTNNPYIYEPKVNNFDEDFFTLTEVVPDTIWTASEFVRTDQGTYALNIGSKGGLPTGGAIDIKVIPNDSADGKYLSIDTSGAHLILRQFDKDGVAQDGFTAILTIKKWA